MNGLLFGILLIGGGVLAYGLKLALKNGRPLPEPASSASSAD
jgi:hypothetical protein